MKSIKPMRLVLIVLGVLLILGLITLFYFGHAALVGYILVAALCIGLVWIGAYYLVRWLQRRKQRRFDAGVAAREGIDDRKREWASWTEELERQGIDRYELPFYLLVGEPQSGKSVLLQNSDLTFPFGQTRLSGIGGTRGCDWWFTEEAVILDLAGRLFTHEGGASDEAEWGAFLELLASYRPACPANGVMLVIPSDSLLGDSRDEATRKASKIQNALLTLTSKLQAQVPIYVIVTKADRVFGFAESVHRLEAEKRHEMFGWSRPAEDFAAPFDMIEVNQAFAGLVARARLLRETMLASVRLPEGQPEADRMYAFPEELAAMAPNLEVYLKRVFSESTLVDRLYFRGFYLTSGLQTGAPIAKVCAELLGSTGEADKRDLEGLFTKQRAYFIKDLVRRRVFSERGLVRPTRARVARARRNAWIGYGVAASIAVLTVIWSAVTAFGKYNNRDRDKFAAAIERAASVANTPPEAAGVRLVFDALEATWAARQVEKLSLEKAPVAVSRQAAFDDLYRTLADQRLLPELRRSAESELALRVQRLGTAVGASGSSEYAQLLELAVQARLLLDGFDPYSDSDVRQVKGLFPKASEGDVADVLRHLLALADDSRGERSLAAGDSAALTACARALEPLWERTLLGGDALQIDGPTGDLVAWRDASEGYGYLQGLDLGKFDGAKPGELLGRAARYHGAYEYFRDPQHSKSPLVLSTKSIQEALRNLRERRAELLGSLERSGAEASSEETWNACTDLEEYLAAQTSEEGKLKLDVEPLKLRSDLLSRACAPDLLVERAGADFVRSASRAIALLVDIAKAPEKDAPVAALARRVVQAKCLVLQAQRREQYDRMASLREALAASAGADAGQPASYLATFQHLTGLAELFTNLESAGSFEPFRDWSRAVDRLLDGVGDQLRREDEDLLAAWSAVKPGSAGTREVVLALHRRLLQVPRDGSSELVLEHVRSWLASVRAPLLETHLESQKELLRLESDLPPASVDLSQTAEAVYSQLLDDSALQSWQVALDRPTLLLSSEASLEEPLRALAGWEPIRLVAEQLRSICAERPPSDGSERSKALRALANQFRDPKVAVQVPLLVENLRKLQRGFVPKRPNESIGDWYLDILFDTVNEKAARSLRRHYLDDLHRRLGEVPRLSAALFAGAKNLGALAQEPSVIAGQLNAFLGPGGAFLELRGKYFLYGQQDGPLDLHPDDGSGAGDAGEWAVHEFLVALSEFLCADPSAQANLDECKVAITLVKPPKRPGVWKQPYLHTVFEKGGNYVQLDFQETDEIGSIDWHFGARQGEVPLCTWSKATDGAKPGDPSLDVRSCLAPLVVAWVWGQPADDALELAGSPRRSARWSIQAPVGKDQQADLTLEFGRALPLRPAWPWRD